MALHPRAKTGRRSTIVLMVSLLLMVGVIGAAGAAPAEKVDVCHYDADMDTFQLISISANAYDAHMAHGDGEPLSMVEGGPTGMYGFNEDCWRWDLNSDLGGEMSAEKVWANGGAYENDHVQNAIDLGYAGLAEITRYTHPSKVQWDFKFENLAANTAYTVYLDNNGGSPGPFALLGTVTTNTSGEGMFGPYIFTLPSGEYTWTFWVNEGGWSVLQSVNDQHFPIS